MSNSRSRATLPKAEGRVDLYWLPLGAGGHAVVKSSGRIFEAMSARHQHRARGPLFHSALEVRVDGSLFVIEMAPAWGLPATNRGVVSEGPVGARWLGRSRLFRYEIRRWRAGQIPDRAEAIASPQRISNDISQARMVLELVAAFPTATWGRDEHRTGDMWNSNSLVAWLLASTNHEMSGIAPPAGGRAPGWLAGLAVAQRQADHSGCCDPGATRVDDARSQPVSV